MQSKIIYDTVIIGSGPAGLTASIYNARADIKTIVVAGYQPGGQLTITTVVENFPGFVNGIGGVKLMMDMQEQAKRLGVEFTNGLVDEVRKEGKEFVTKLKDGRELRSRAVIVATGAKARWLGIENEDRLIGRGISGCATCDGAFFRDKRVAVVGGGNAAVEEASFLTKFAKKVYLIHRRDQLRASAIERKRVENNPKIEIWWNTEVKELIGQEKLERIRVENNVSGKIKEVPMDGMFVAIGHLPATDFVKELVDLTETGHIITGEDRRFRTMSSRAGIFAAGDCADSIYRQAVVAAGEGAKAALDAERWIGEQVMQG